MIVSEPGAAFEFEGMNYMIGGPVVCTGASIYEGLYGVITEIRDGADKETDNETPDMYCRLDAPVHPSDVERLEQAFSKAMSLPVTLEEIALDQVIMAPGMIKPLETEESKQRSIPIYIVREDWTLEYHDGTSVYQFTDYHEAKRKFNKMLQAEMAGGCVSEWSGNKSLCTDIGEDTYECWLDGDYGSHHYCLSILSEKLALSAEVFERIGRDYINQSHKEDFLTSAEEQEIAKELGEERYKAFISDPRITGLIDKELDRGTRYWEEYWSAVDSVVCELKREYEKQSSEAKGYGEQKESTGQ